MSESKFETISSLVDNYRSPTHDTVAEQAIDEMLKNEHLASSWQNYHLIGDVMRDEVPNSLQIDLSGQIADAIAQETTILSPNSSSSPEQSADNVEGGVVTNNSEISGSIEITSPNRFKAKITQLIKPLGQVAIAASAAGLMIVGVQQNTTDNQLDNQIMPSQVVQTMPLSGYANPVSFNFQSIGKQAQLQSQKEAANKQIIAQQRRFQALLSDHQQQIKLTAGIKTKETIEKK